MAIYALLLCCLLSSAQAKLTGKLAYTDHGKLLLQTLPAGKPVVLMHKSSGRPLAWSPSGRWLLAGQHIFDCSSNKPRRVIVPDIDEAERVAWSPVEDVLAYEYNGGLYVTRPGEAHARMLRAPIPAEEIDPTRMHAGVQDDFLWSPDGKRLAYVDVHLAKWVTKDGRTLYDESSAVWSIDLAGKAPRRLLAISVDDDYRALLAAWTPDGAAILFHQQLGRAASGMRYGRPLVALPATGGKMRVLTENTPVYADAFSFAPDHRRIVLPENVGPLDTGTWRLAILSLNNQHQVFLTGMAAVAVDPVWSPTGQQIAYLRTHTAGNSEGIFYETEKLPGIHLWLATLGRPSRHRALTTGRRYREEAPQWSHDGRTLLFTRIDKQYNASLWSINTNSTGLHRLVAHLGWTGKPGEFYYRGEGRWYYAWWQDSHQ